MLGGVNERIPVKSLRNMVSLVTSLHSAKMGVSSKAGLWFSLASLAISVSVSCHCSFSSHHANFKSLHKLIWNSHTQASNRQGQSEIGNSGRCQVVVLSVKNEHCRHSLPSPKDAWCLWMICNAFTEKPSSPWTHFEDRNQSYTVTGRENLLAKNEVEKKHLILESFY